MTGGIRGGRDLLCGLVFAAIGAAGLWVGRDYPVGTPVRLGTGVFPRLLCWGLIATGTILGVKSLITDGPRLTGWAWRPVILVTAAAIAFALLVEPAGLIVAMLALMGLGALAGEDHRRGELAAFMAIMLVLGLTIFIWGLGMPIKVFPMELSALYDNLALGFSVAASFQNLFWCLVGAIVGTAIGVLPGVGPVATMALLLPVTYYLPAEGALIMLAGIYYGAQYGGSTTAILVNLPGESSSVVTCLDGYAMARQGRAGPALAIAAIGSFIAGCIATMLIAVAAPPLTRLAQQFGPADYCSLMLLGLVTAIVMAHGSVIKAIGMVLLGLLLGIAGTDVNTGNLRYTFGIDILFDGINFVPIAMGVFGLNEIMANLTNPERRDLVSSKVTGLMPTRADLRASIGAILRGTGLGSVLGILPGGGAVLASFAAYTLEKRISRTPEKFGTGMIQGVAAPESANNAAAQTSFIPMLTLGIPSNAVMAMMVGGMMIHGIIPGPQVMTDKPGLFWGMIVSMWIGNLMLVVFNLPLVGIWVKMLMVPYRLLSIAILFFCCIGVYSLNNSADEVLLIAFFGVVGYMFVKLDCEPAPMLLGFILGPMMETYLRRAMLLSRGDAMVFVNRPLSLSFLIAASLLLLLLVLPKLRRAREEAFQE